MRKIHLFLCPREKTCWQEYTARSEINTGYRKKVIEDLYFHVEFHLQKWNKPPLPGKGICSNHYFWHNKKTGAIVATTWEWAEFDGKQLFYADKGKIFSIAITQQGLSGEKLLLDTISIVFSERTAPY